MWFSQRILRQAQKKTVAGLRKLKKSIEDSDKEVKAQWMETI